MKKTAFTLLAMLGGLLLHLLPQTPPYEVVVDRTEWYFGETPVNVLRPSTFL